MLAFGLRELKIRDLRFLQASGTGVLERLAGLLTLLRQAEAAQLVLLLTFMYLKMGVQAIEFM